MQPAKLVINAFLSASGREEIDFSNIDEEILKKLDTDVQKGKAFLLDCICYALFGKFKAEPEKKDGLRCPAANALDEAFVELEFFHDGKKYRIFRKPAQVREKKRFKDPADKLMKVAAKSELEFLAEDRPLLKRRADIDKEISSILKMDAEKFVKFAEAEFFWLQKKAPVTVKTVEKTVCIKENEQDKRRKERALRELKRNLPEIARGKKLAGLCYSIINNNLKVIDNNVDICYKNYCLKLSVCKRAEECYNRLKEKLDNAGVEAVPKHKDNKGGFWESVIEIGRLFSAEDRKVKKSEADGEVKLTEDEVKALQRELSEAIRHKESSNDEKLTALAELKEEVENFQKEVNSLTELFNSYYDLFVEVLNVKGYPSNFELPEIKLAETDEKVGYVIGYDVRIIHETMLKLTAVQSKVAGIGNRLSKQYSEAIREDTF